MEGTGEEATLGSGPNERSYGLPEFLQGPTIERRSACLGLLGLPVVVCCRASDDSNVGSTIGDDSMPGPAFPTTRREFLQRLGAVVAGSAVTGLGLSLPARRAAAAPPALSKRLLEESPFAYISPLLANGQESRCHGEVWYAWIDDAVVVTVASDRWKAAALAKGYDRARVWIGDHGRWKTWSGGRNEAFLQGARFDARVDKADDPGLIETLLSAYARKYPSEIDQWRDKMRAGAADGSRVLLRYRPLGEVPSASVE
jgi:hypothetical protein